MASTASLVQYVVDQIGPGATSRAMFGEYAIYYRGTLVALFCDDRLFLKATRAAATILGPHELGSPYPGAKPAIVVPEESWDDGALLARLARESAAELAKAPAPKATRRPAKAPASKAARKPTARAPRGKAAAARKPARRRG